MEALLGGRSLKIIEFSQNSGEEEEEKEEARKKKSATMKYGDAIFQHGDECH